MKIGGNTSTNIMSLMDTEKNYTKEMEKLHQKQFESLPEEKQYKRRAHSG